MLHSQSGSHTPTAVFCAAVAACLIAVPGCSRGSNSPGDEAKLSQTSIADLVIKDVKTGEGPAATPGHKVRVHYTGWLYHPTNEGNRGRKFDSSRDRGEPFEFSLGKGEVIRGWDEGVAGMRVGSIRTLVIPARLAYGPRGAGDAIPPDATLVFEVELLGVE